jgi:hypothetical protein
MEHHPRVEDLIGSVSLLLCQPLGPYCLELTSPDLGHDLGCSGGQRGESLTEIGIYAGDINSLELKAHTEVGNLTMSLLLFFEDQCITTLQILLDEGFLHLRDAFLQLPLGII